MDLITSSQIKQYFKKIEEEVARCYSVAKEARQKNLDPEPEVPIPLANNMAERVVGLISVVSPKIKETTVTKRISELEKKYGTLDWRVGFKIAEEVAKEKFYKFETKQEAIEVGIRVGFAYLTLGIVSAPLEGFIGLKIKKRRDNKEYFAIKYAGPIRGAGGTAASTSVVLADYVRVSLGYSSYDPTEDEINRYVTEVSDYHERVTNLQYLPSEEELRYLLSHLPVEVDGEPTEKFEVSNYKDLERIETNLIRGGVALVLAEGLSQKAAKLWKRLGKWGKDFNLEWDFLGGFLELKEKIHAKSTKDTSEEDSKLIVKPNNTFIMDLVAGRPILTHPLATGGFRLRYGRSRTTGFSASAAHGATLIVLQKYIAIGTQLKTERPGKATTITVCDCLEGPIVKLDDESVVQLTTQEQAKQLNPRVSEIIFLGDILFNYGDFSENGQRLVPAGYCPEWWVRELEKAIENRFEKNKLSKAASLLNIEEERLKKIIENHWEKKIDWELALAVSSKLSIPLHPDFTYYWKLICAEEVLSLKKWLQEGKIKNDEKGIWKIILPYSKQTENHLIGKKALEELGVPHHVVNKENIVLQRKEAQVLAFSFNFKDQKGLESITLDTDSIKGKNGLEIINYLCGLTIRDKAGTFIGARMGRPEKAKVRQMTGSPQVMFPVGDEGDRLRSFQSTLKAGKIRSTFPTFYCENCQKEMIYRNCEECQKECVQKFSCRFCGDLDTQTCRHGNANPYKIMDLDISYYFNKAQERIGELVVPDLIKGVRGTSNKNHLLEHLSKGILRAKHSLYVNKDGTTRYDGTELPITHFKPKEIRTSIEKLIELGYTKDIYDAPLTSVEQILEIKPQDIILPGYGSLEDSSIKVLTKVANFIDDLLIKFYKMEPFYKINKIEDLAGHLVIGLAPHISAGLVGRIIGFSDTQGIFTHPMYHAGMRRDCDGDEACVMLLMDALLNFSRQYLPERRGAKSITPDTLIYYRKDNKITTEKIGKLIDNLLKRNKNKVVCDKDYEILNLNGYAAISFDKRTQKVNFSPITKFIRHQSPKHIYEVTTSHGKIKVTGDHSIFVTKGKNIVEKEVRDLEEGENIIALGKINLPKLNIKQLDLCKIIPHKIYVLLENSTINQIKQISSSKKNFLLKKWKNNYYRYLNKQRKAPLNFILDSGIGFVGKKIYSKNGSSMPRYLQMNENVVRLSAYLISEGYLREKKTAEIVNTNVEIIKEIKESLQNILKRKVLVFWDKRKGKKPCGRIRLTSILRDVFIALGHKPKNSEKKHLPPFVFYLANNLKKLFLECYTKGDGHHYIEKNFTMLYSKSPFLAAELSLLAHSLGNKTSINKGHRSLQILFSDYNNTDPWWPLTDFTKELYGAFRKEGLVKEEINRLLSNYRKNKRLKSASRFAVSKFVGLLNHKENKSINKLLAKIKDSDVRVERVRKIEKIQSPYKSVYDLEVPKHQNFLCGPHPIFAHNTMDAPLVLTSLINPSEVDDQVHGMDIVWNYPLELYEAATQMKNPWEVKWGSEQKKIEQIGDRLETPLQYEKMGYTHPVENVNKGVLCSDYKLLPSMQEKLRGQMEIARKVRAVDMDDVAKLVIQKHFLKDIKGNLKKFSMQQFRCVKCNEKYRRPPLNAKCRVCEGKLIFTISHGSVIKYLGPSLLLAQEYDFSPYLKQTLLMIQSDVDNVFGREKDKQVGLGSFIG